MELRKICIRCQKYIYDKEAYIEIKEFDRGELVRVNFMHKNCWEETMDSKKKVNEAWGVFKKLTGTMKKEGILPEEEFIIK